MCVGAVRVGDLFGSFQSTINFDGTVVERWRLVTGRPFRTEDEGSGVEIELPCDDVKELIDGKFVVIMVETTYQKRWFLNYVIAWDRDSTLWSTSFWPRVTSDNPSNRSYSSKRHLLIENSHFSFWLSNDFLVKQNEFSVLNSTNFNAEKENHLKRQINSKVCCRRLSSLVERNIRKLWINE